MPVCMLYGYNEDNLTVSLHVDRRALTAYRHVNNSIQGTTQMQENVS